MARGLVEADDPIEYMLLRLPTFEHPAHGSLRINEKRQRRYESNSGSVSNIVEYPNQLEYLF
jgi:hypothetical protein